MSGRRHTNRAFIAMGIAAAWFLGYLLIHEVLTHHMIAGTRLDRGTFILGRENADEIRKDFAASLPQLEKIVETGAWVARKCIICHSENLEQRRFGPTLYGVLGTEVAKHVGEWAYPFGPDEGTTGYRYSPALQRIHARGEVWSVPSMWAFVNDPEKFIPKTRMPFPGLGPSCREDDSGVTICDSAEKATAQNEINSLIHYLGWSCNPDCGGTAFLVKLELEKIESAKWTKDTYPEDALCIAPTSAQRFLGTKAEYLLLPEEVVVTNADHRPSDCAEE